MPELPLGPRGPEAIAAAVRILEAEGPAAVSIRRVGAELGMQGPSLYNHVRDKATLEAGIAAHGLAAMGDALAAAAPGLDGLGRAYRAFARARPHLYRALTDRPLPRDLLPDGLEADVGAYVARAVGGDEHRARALWAAAHGLVLLELADRFPPGADLDAAWSALVAAFAAQPSTPAAQAT